MLLSQLQTQEQKKGFSILINKAGSVLGFTVEHVEIMQSRVLHKFKKIMGNPEHLHEIVLQQHCLESKDS